MHILSQLQCENGQFTPDRQELGGTHHFGLAQVNPDYADVYSPEWRKDWKLQVRQFLDLFQARMDLYSRDYNRIMLHHFSPAAARRNAGDIPKHAGSNVGYVENINSNCKPLFTLTKGL